MKRITVGPLVGAAISATIGCNFDVVNQAEPSEATQQGDPGAFVDLTLATNRPTTGSLQSGTALNVPEDAVTESVEIRLERPDEGETDDLLARYTGPERILTAPHQLSPYDLTLEEAAILTMPLTTETSSSLAVVMWLDGETDATWERGAPARIEGERGFATLDRFGIVMLVEADAASFGPDAGSFELPGDLSEEELEDLREQYEN